MFATQQHTDMMETGRKRHRDEADLANGPAGFSEHRAKRVQCLPVRTSPMSVTMQQNMSSPTMMASSMGETDFATASDYTIWQNSSSHDQQMATMESVEMQSAIPSYLQPDAVTGRIPTPIQPSFVGQLRGQQWANSSAAAGRRGIANMGHHQVGLADQPCAQCDAPQDRNWQMQNDRRLPSPISESEDCMAHSPGHLTALQAMEHPNAMMDVEIQRPTASDDGEGDPDSPTSHRKGHTRSRHTVNTWTWQPGMKRSFSIGYRSDCDKCRDKVPGHFNHIIIS
ncbi:hypothetical protein CRV24_006636 [Beauveria bassiana]|uniref:Uncharacterized protein n=1 Tax=Beauveria bassiana (strain ARSEF 2860) TaxID=655819 RepID=J5JRI5_BEAB2|nr:uncharacterized protein BBA_05692 [Beauveria bassiana ARSEF 2860]EJP65361.1 hypothetical protein BBA_05692 [Beauveria bassiana ARSEF 2860]KAF1732744.1 hypothetical protein CRV24_006636 [Beauveria bassiana]KAH8713225.1 hypothetical protein HC256_006390 [Beauveria bassiana]